MATQDLTLFEPQHVSMVVRPLMNPIEARQAIQEYEALKAAIVQPGDVQKIQGRDFLKKSFWRRVATCFGVSLELVSEERGFDEGKHLYYSVLYRAVAPNGRTMIGDGYCSTAEQGHGAWPEHNVRATAHTRAKNRAISDLVGGGEVSAEEMQDYVDSTPPPPTRPTRPAPARSTRNDEIPMTFTVEETTPADETRPVLTAQMLRDRAGKVGIKGAAWGALWREYKGELDGINAYLDARAFARTDITEDPESSHSLEGLPVNGMH